MASDIERVGIQVDADVQNAIQNLNQFVHAMMRIPGIMDKTGKSFDESSVRWDAASKRYKATAESGKQVFVKASEAARVFGERTVASFARVATSMETTGPGIYATGKAVADLGQQFAKTNVTAEQNEQIMGQVRKIAKELGVDIEHANEKAAKAADGVVKAYESQQRAARNLANAQEGLKKAGADNAAATLRVQNAQSALRQATVRLNQTKRSYQTVVENASKSTRKASATTLQFAQNLGFLQVKARAAVTATGTQFSGQIKMLGLTLKTASKPLLVVAGLLAGLAAGGLVAVKALGLIKKAFSALLRPVQSAIDKFKHFTSRALSVTTGILFRDTLRSIFNQLRELGSMALTTAANIETLTVRMEVLIARYVRAEGAAQSYSDVMQQSSDRAQGMLRWIQQLAMTAPIDVEDIATVSSLAMAFGWTEDQARQLTRTVAMFTAGMGLGTEHMQRIIFNFGQMKAAAKVTGTEIRDLVRGSFFPMIDVLDKAAETMGLTGEGMIELRKLAAEGAIPTDVFFKAFIDVVERDFPDALERMGRTMRGVMTRAKSLFKTLVGFQVLGPIIDRLSDSMATFLDSLATPETLNKARMVGRALLKSYDMVSWFVRNNLIPALKELASALGLPAASARNLIYAMAWMSYATSRAIRIVSRIITGVATRIRETLDGIKTQSYSWGFNVIAMFARGIMAAAQWVVNAINTISGVIRKWLAPGSPPLALPELPQWGAGAMTEYLRGFMLADFNVLRAIQAPIRDALAMFVDLGAITQLQMAEMYAGLSKEIAEAISSGEFAEDLFDRIAEQTGEFGEEIALLARRQIELAAAIKEVEYWERKLADARKREEQAGVKVNKMVQEYNDMLRQGATAGELEAMREKINEQVEARELAKEERLEAEEQVDVAKEQLAIYEELAKVQQELVNQLIEITRLFIEAQKSAGGGEGILPPEEFPEFEAPVFDIDELPDIEAELNEIFANAIKAVDEFFAKWKERWNEFRETYIDPLVSTWENLKASVVGGWNNYIAPTLDWVQQKWNDFKNWSGWEGVGEAASGAWKFIVDEARYWWGLLVELWNEHGGELQTIWGATWSFFMVVPKISWAVILSTIGYLAGVFERFWSEHGEELKGIVIRTWGWIRRHISRNLRFIGLLIRLGASAIEGDWGTFWDTVEDIQENRLEHIEDFAETHWANVAASATIGWETAKRELGVLWETISEKAQEVWGILADWLSGKWESIKEEVSLIGEGIKEKILIAWEYISGKAEEIWEGIKDKILAVISGILEWAGVDLEELKARWQAITEDIRAIAEEIWSRIVEKIVEIVEKIKDIVNEKIEELKVLLTSIWEGIRKIAVEKWEETKQQIAEKVEEIKKGVNEKIEELKKTLDTTWGQVKKAITDIWEDIKKGVAPLVESFVTQVVEPIEGILITLKGKWDEFVQAGKDFIEGMIEGIKGAISGLVEAVTGGIEDVLSSIKKKLGISSPSEVTKEFGVAMIDGIVEGLSNAVTGAISVIQDAMGNIISSVFGMFTDTDWASIGSSITDGIKDSITGGAKKIADAAKSAASSAFNAAKDFLNMGSPSKLFMGVGEDIMKGWVIGIEKMINAPAEQMIEASERMAAASRMNASVSAMPVMPYGAGASSGTNINFGGTTINSVMDQATFENRVIRAVKKASR